MPDINHQGGQNLGVNASKNAAQSSNRRPVSTQKMTLIANNHANDAITTFNLHDAPLSLALPSSYFNS